LSGSLDASDTAAGNGALNPDQAVSCVQIVIPEDITAGSGLYFDVTTNGSTDVGGPVGGADTELLLFGGTVLGGSGFIVSDDDDATGLLSAFTFGDGAGARRPYW